MKKTGRMLLAFVLLITLVTCAPARAAAPEQPAYSHETPPLTEYGILPLPDGVEMEYGTYGDAQHPPLLLLSANGGDMHGYDTSILPELAKSYYVLTVSIRGTGNTAHGPGKLTFEQDSEDLICLLDALGIEKTSIFGYSDGGNLALVFAAAHIDRVERLAILSANINTSGTKFWYQIKNDLRYLYLSILYRLHPTEELLLEKDILGKMVGQPRLHFTDLRRITVPVLHMFGQYDMFYRLHFRLISAFLPDVRDLMIMDGGHVANWEQCDTVILPALLAFFAEAETPAP